MWRLHSSKTLSFSRLPRYILLSSKPISAPKRPAVWTLFLIKVCYLSRFIYLFIYLVGGRVGAVSSGDVHSLSLSMLQNVCFHPSLKHVKAAWCYLLSAHPNATLPQSLCPTSHDRSQAINLCMFWQLHRLKASLQQWCHSVFKCWARLAVHTVEKCQNSANSAVSVNLIGNALLWQAVIGRMRSYLPHTGFFAINHSHVVDFVPLYVESFSLV